MSDLLVPRFEDVHPKYSASGFVATNEEPKIFNMMLGKVKVKTAATIASGGEILLSTILPRTTGEVIAVDHSYRAITACISKMLILQRVTMQEMSNMVYRGDSESFRKLIAEVTPFLPEELKKHDVFSGFNGVEYEWANIRKGWSNVDTTLRTVKSVYKRVKFLHACLTDLPGAYDLLYVSNAMEHQNRDGKYLKLGDLAHLVNPGGFLLLTSNDPNTAYYGYKKADEKVYGFSRLADPGRGINSTWYYVVLQKKANAAPIAAPAQAASFNLI